GDSSQATRSVAGVPQPGRNAWQARLPLPRRALRIIGNRPRTWPRAPGTNWPAQRNLLTGSPPPTAGQAQPTGSRGSKSVETSSDSPTSLRLGVLSSPNESLVLRSAASEFLA